MRPLVVGKREDLAGFALAGIEGVVCTTREEADQVIAQAGADTLIIVSAELAPETSHRALVVALPSRS